MRFSWLGLLPLAMVACAPSPSNNPTAVAVAVAPADVGDAAGDAMPDTVGDAGATEVAEEAVEVLPADIAPAAVATVAQRFVAAGGQALCLGMIRAMNPDWQLDACNVIDDQERKDRCVRQRSPMVRFAENFCRACIEEGLRQDMDPAMGLAVSEQEASIGRRTYDDAAKVYRITTNVCETFLSSGRITCGAAGKPACSREARRAGTVQLCWTYGEWGRQDCRAVFVKEETPEGLRVDTCVAGERGSFQTVPREWRQGTVVEATGEVLVGTQEEREKRLLGDPVLQVRLGFQALADHRVLAPEERRNDWWTWIPIFNSGKDCLQPGVCGEDLRGHWNTYLRNISRHYLRGCEGWFRDAAGRVVLVERVWSECGRVRAAREALPD